MEGCQTAPTDGDAAALAQFNRLVYGTSAPAAGVKPLRSIPALGSFAASLRQRDNAGNHAICGWCWREVVPSITLSPPQVPLNERVAEKCCRCGHVSFDGIYLSSESSYPFCDH